MRSAAFRRALIVALALALLVSFLLASCSDTPTPGELDAANIVVGDASVLDVGLRPDAAPAADAIALDATETSSDAAVASTDARVEPDAAAGNRDAAVEPDATIPPECNGAAIATLTATDALAQAAALDGMIVDIVGTATVGPTRCTRTACPPENPCCNRCSAGIDLEGGLLLTAGPCSGNVGCTGDECNLVCSPPLLGFPQTFRGTVRSPDALELHRVLP